MSRTAARRRTVPRKTTRSSRSLAKPSEKVALLTGTFNVTLYRGDRSLWEGPKITLRLIDPFLDNEKVVAEAVVRGPAVNILDVPAERGQNYVLLASAPGFRDAAIFPVKVRAGGIKHTAVMLVHDKPTPNLAEFNYKHLKQYSPEFGEALENGGITEAVFRNLDTLPAIAALNIEAKLRSVQLGDRTAVSFVKRIDTREGLLRDRLYARVEPAMVAALEEAKEFTQLPEWANEVFHKGFPISFKERVPFGSLQVSLSSEAGDDGLLAADIDIDLFTDIGHFGEVLRNKITRQRTDPYTVYVQLFDQRIFPLYRLQA